MKTSVRVVLINHGAAGDWGGGDSVQINKTAEKLRQRKYSVSIQNADKPEIEDADIVHIFNCRVYQSFEKQITTAKAAGKPIRFTLWIKF